MTEQQRMEALAANLVDLYGRLVKRPELDTSRAQARKNAAKLMASGVQFLVLQKAVMNFADAMERLRREPEHRKNVGNFFGRESVYEDYMPGVYVPPANNDQQGLFDPIAAMQENMPT